MASASARRQAWSEPAAAGTRAPCASIPPPPRPLRATIAADLVVLLLLAALAVLGTQVHDGVDQLAQIGEGVEEAGGSIRSAFDTAADGVDGLPLVGGDLAGISPRRRARAPPARAIDAGPRGAGGRARPRAPCSAG